MKFDDFELDEDAGKDVVDEATGEVISCPWNSTYMKFLADGRAKDGPGTAANLSAKELMRKYATLWKELTPAEKETLEEANKAHKARFLALGGVFKGAPKKM
tara:strand:+ start:407 stop:712 length:306 start_codon:yes stop_codon:yes gene_type:complete